MKVRARTLVMIVTATFSLAACGGKQTMASKSAAAYDAAKQKGLSVSAGEHGGHAVEGASPTQMPEMDHSKMPAMDHSKMKGMDHSKMAGMDHSKMTGMDHSNMTGMDHSKMKGMDHSKMTEMDHQNMTGMDHGAMAGMQHAAAPPPADMNLSVPKSNEEIARTQPAATLRPDEFDAPAKVALDEAAKTVTPPREER